MCWLSGPGRRPYPRQRSGLRGPGGVLRTPSPQVVVTSLVGAGGHLRPVRGPVVLLPMCNTPKPRPANAESLEELPDTAFRPSSRRSLCVTGLTAPARVLVILPGAPAHGLG